MNRDHNQPWIFFWATPDSNYFIHLDEEREFKRKVMMRRALLNRIISEVGLEEPPQAG
ncbi:MAG: hypothetical protein PHT28_00430 [Dehalococcoidales bacterium]|jgi:hypothetical protein|nr:hypothetical protein [Dehalococcoidales bacterium]MDD4229877.1 hypothetical protein [Dehalococcoidales bacterium]MDD4465080.1 hypothetical protein [Dehalococcoidales bacterium]MDD5401904.1 hypothetical protein [Dehalococcoidales bacterium]